jgi:hypothetical protein
MKLFLDTAHGHGGHELLTVMQTQFAERVCNGVGGSGADG